LGLTKADKKKCRFYFTWEYMTGFCLMVTAAVTNVGKSFMVSSFVLVSLGYADMITLSSASSFTLIFNSILASYVLGEIFTRYDLFCFIFISSGAALCVLQSNFTSQDYTIDVSP